MLLNVSLQNSVEMLEFSVSNESYYVDLRKRQGISVFRAGPGQDAIFIWHNGTPIKFFHLGMSSLIYL